jgi:nucleoside-diphosphate-sugar epimerase
VKVILSGAGGNLGKHIKMRADFEIVPVDRNGWEALEKSETTADAFIHLAYDLKKNLFDAPDEILDSNLISTMRALRFCKASKIPKFIFLSSCSVYGHSSRTTEDVPCSPVTVNGLTKYLNEKIISEFCRHAGIKSVVMRAFNSFGGDDQFSVISKLLKAVHSNSKFTLYNNGLGERDFIHVDDIARVACHFVQNDAKHEVINVGTGKSTRIIDIVTEVEKVTGKKIAIEHKKNEPEVEYSRADISRLKEEVDFKFKDILEFIRTLK